MDVKKKTRKPWPAQRSLKHLRDNGWTVCKVEYFMKHPGMPFGVRRDVWGFGDILACRPATYHNCLWCRGTGHIVDDIGREEIVCDRCLGEGKFLAGTAGVALVQCCADNGGSFAEHREKILAIPEFQIWKNSGGRVFLHGWGMRGPKGEKKPTLREEEL